MEDPESSPIDLAPKPSRRFRFGLRGLIVIVTLAAIVFAPLGMVARRKQREEMAIELLTKLGAHLKVRRATTRTEALYRLYWGDPWEVSFGTSYAPTHQQYMFGNHDFKVFYPYPTGTLEYAYNPEKFDITDDQMPEVASALHQLSRVDRLSFESQVLTVDGLIQLRNAPELDELDLRCPLVTSRGTDALQQKFPKLVILDD